MAKILFGLSGDGIGHGSRSKSTIAHLIERGHEVRIVSSGKGYEFLSDYYQVVQILYLKVAHETGEVNAWKTLKENFEKLFKYGAGTFRKLLKEVDRFQPDIIITDFEPFLSIIGSVKRIPLLSIDNQHVINLCKLEYPRSWRKDYLVAWTVCEGLYDFADHFLITSFFMPELKKRVLKKATQVGPIVRSEVLEQKPSSGDHIIMYMKTPEAVEAMMPLIDKLDGCSFLAYGFSSTSLNHRNIIFKRTGREFLRDLVTAKAVITNGGHSLISEALYLGKPIFCIPIRKAFEQMINAYYVEKLGYGMYDFSPSAEQLRTFLDNIERYKQNIERDRRNFDGNSRFFALLDAKIEELRGGKKRFSVPITSSRVLRRAGLLADR